MASVPGLMPFLMPLLMLFLMPGSMPFLVLLLMLFLVPIPLMPAPQWLGVSAQQGRHHGWLLFLLLFFLLPAT
jgi:hypothetical protein